MIGNRRRFLYQPPLPLTNANNEWEEIARTGNSEKISASIYNATQIVNGKKTYVVRDLLKQIYHNKCVYCESIEFKPEIEHYRPKKSVTGVNTHPGYYWLCYEWTNLMPSCRYCNTEGGKGNKFPVMGHRVNLPIFDRGSLEKASCRADSQYLLGERPYLLHPDIDTPENCFSFDNKGKIKGIDLTERGSKTISICNLNRDNLKYRRQSIVDRIVVRINDAFSVYFMIDQSEPHLNAALQQVFQEMKDNCNPEKPFSLLSIFAFNNFGIVVAPLLATSTQKTFTNNSFNEFRIANPV
ncbi:hypothetical protein [uncultured Imperialibacter sp.]|uniref:hypothetical protein n=1 Tax=uncultured Imperialibacter sp. TaxID=1672639 RepID=UPI0030D7EBFE|tara:strand:+ start:62125 stop:63015 length:891 start_codon:yes stop_codon:yes gene_type:complete